MSQRIRIGDKSKVHLYFVYVSSVFLNGRCMSGAVCAVVCVCVSFAWEVGVCFVLLCLHDPFLLMSILIYICHFNMVWCFFYFSVRIPVVLLEYQVSTSYLADNLNLFQKVSCMTGYRVNLFILDENITDANVSFGIFR